MSTVFPDVCKTPSPGGPVPVPYPNVGKSADTSAGPTSVTCDGSMSPVHVGGNVRVAVTLPAGADPGKSVEIEELPHALLRPVGADALSATFLAKSPGHTQLNIILVDPKTLLSPALGASVDVLP
jgi:hypothetical protein